MAHQFDDCDVEILERCHVHRGFAVIALQWRLLNRDRLRRAWLTGDSIR